MAWVVLVVSGLFETVWAAALSASHGLTRLWPAVVFVAALAVSMVGLGFALRTVPVGTGYAVWVGVGAVGTAVFGMLTKGDPVTVGRITCLVLIVAGIAGLKVLQ